MSWRKWNGQMENVSSALKLFNPFFIPICMTDRQSDSRGKADISQAETHTDRQFDRERTSIFVFGQTTGVVSCFTAFH